MTATANRVLKEIRALPAPELRLVWQEVNAMMLQLEPPPILAPAETASREEIMAALDRLTGCTAGSRSLPRLLDERHREREREASELQTYLARRRA